MNCFVKNVVAESQTAPEIKTLIPDAGLRRRMSRILKTAVATAVECAGGVGAPEQPDAIITATGLGLLTDSERFLRNMIAENEQLLNPTPFIQSTFNTVGGQIAMMGRNHGYNVTYVNRSQGFEDAMLDAMMRFADRESRTALVGAFDEQTPAQHRIMERMGFWRRCEECEGAVFALLTAEPSAHALAEVAVLDFPARPLAAEACLRQSAATPRAVLLTEEPRQTGLSPVAAAQRFAAGVRAITEGAEEVILYNEHRGRRPSVMVLRCIGR